MKKQLLWISVLLIFLLLAACAAKPEATEPTEFRVACFGCKELFVSGQLNADFGLCQSCMMEVGAAYCQNCSAPCYTRDMIHGLCSDCSVSTQETTELEEKAQCTYCGQTVLLEYMVGDYCLTCNCMRNGKCLKCTENDHLTEGGYCEQCLTRDFICAGCRTRKPGSEAYKNLCRECYGKEYSVLVICPLCGRSIAPSEIKRGYCESCRAQADYHEDERNFATCDVCGITYGYSDPLVGGVCQSCWSEGDGPIGVCRTCGKAYGDDGFEGLCFSCQDKYGPKCSVCGTDLTYRGGIDGMCDDCYDAANSCKKCGSQTYKDGYCYYCHPDFNWFCANCGQQNPDYGPADKLCDYCKCDRCDAVLTTPGGINGFCEQCDWEIRRCFVCMSYPTYKEGYCYDCYPSFTYTCSKCGEQYVAYSESGLCPLCDSQG